ncbi:hypothetical protein ACMD2_15643 [Ananas comosus]|uniref:Uncharacterized protein n=1 Tax=Ananas comosus TaxID=4615 RepID=A0A199UW23_ANACO|nr:hypothetical protein ACMD2_15643 [Ananas comosus]
MATGWVRALRCKSNAVDDVASPPISLKKPLLLPISCADSSLLPKYPSSFPKIPSAAKRRRRARASSSSSSSRSKAKPSAFPASPMAAAAAAAEGGAFPTLAEVPEGHSSRRVVEIIFVSSWGAAPFPGEIEMLFRVHNPARTAARFEEYRDAVRARAARSGEPRCAADGNEVMRFHCGGGGGVAAEGIYDARVATCAVAAAAGAEGIRTFAGSGRAHESGCGGGGAGRRAMLVCRVIAGRVRTESDPESEGDSVSLGKGELVVFDRRAVLPCFLIIYKINTSN